jgi:hypothetical protein
LVAVLYKSTDSVGTYTTFTLDRLLFAPNVGGVVDKHVIVVREEQSRKTPFPILVTLLGIVTEVREEQL